ncbi:hypothetical protein [Vibrio variabilis]|uniref:hypothetical protein n=1 Tax=Vibrio variabilis TaxID=990271 RepID=UPI001EFA1672|nr:hypothetical protein [Vibrio variabilis]
MRETAILGVLGVATLGFYVDSAFEDIRFDRAIFYIFITALLNLAIDATSRHLQRYNTVNSIQGVNIRGCSSLNDQTCTIQKGSL